MAGANLLALIDDIATLLDDVALMTKVAAKKTAGVLGDDLAVNAEQVTGFSADRELPVVWAVFKGSLLNKLILVPAALLISAFTPWAITPILMIGGAYLCFEGSEKIVHLFSHDKAQQREKLVNVLSDKKIDLLAYEKKKISGAVRTDFILSAEIIAISLGVVSEAAIQTQILTLSTIALLITIGVYGLVAAIVKLDDLGLYLFKKQPPFRQMGSLLLSTAPKLMKFLSIAGTAAMFFVGGGILTHGIHPLAHAIEDFAARQDSVIAFLISNGVPALIGVFAGLVLVAFVSAIHTMRKA